MYIYLYSIFVYWNRYYCTGNYIFVLIPFEGHRSGSKMEELLELKPPPPKKKDKETKDDRKRNHNVEQLFKGLILNLNCEFRVDATVGKDMNSPYYDK